MIRFPTGAEAQVARRLVRRLRVLDALLREQLPDRRAVLSQVEAARRALQATSARLPEALEASARAVVAQTQAAVLTEIKRATGTDASRDMRLALVARDLDEERRTWAKRCTAAANKAEAEALDRIEARLSIDGIDAKVVLDEERRRLDARLYLIARSEVGTLQSEVNRRTQVALGISSYVWRSQRDHAVRDAHELLDGTVRRWSDPHPVQGHPGDAIGCRCVALPIISL